MQSPHVRCWGDNGSRISVLRLVFRRRLARARGKLEHGRCRALPSLLALLADQPPDEIMHACRRHVRYSITLLNDQPDLQKELIDTINEASSTRGQRYDVIHGHWHLGRKKEEARI